jgi:hypothetical protein
MYRSVEDAVAAVLGPDEKLLWGGRARQGFMLRSSDFFEIPFSLLACTLFASGAVAASRIPGFRGLHPWLLPLFVLLSLYVLCARFVLDLWRRQHTFYVVTSKRVIILSGALSNRIRSFRVEGLTDVTLAERPSGCGTIMLARVPLWDRMHATRNWGVHDPDLPMLILDSDARHVYDLIQSAATSKTPRAPSAG